MPMMAVSCGMPMRAHDRVVAEDAAEIVGVGENVFLERKKNAGGIDEINCRDAIFDGDILRADDFFRGHREKRAGFYGGVVGDEHEHAAADAGEAGDGACCGRAAPLFVHFPGGVGAQLEEMRAGIDQLRDAFARGEPAFFVLRLDRFGAAALRDLLFFIFDLSDEIDDLAAVFGEVGRLGVDGGFQDGRRHSQSLAAKWRILPILERADRPVMAAGNSVYGLRWASASAAGNCADKVQRVGYTVRQRIG